MIEAVEQTECATCGAQTLCVLVMTDDPYMGAHVCLACVCKAFGVKTPPGPYTPWQPAPPAKIELDPANEIDPKATISPELQAEVDAMLGGRKS